MTHAALAELLTPYNQQHVLDYWDEIDDASRQRLADQIRAIDLTELQRLLTGKDEKPDFAAMAERATPPPSVGVDGEGIDWSVEQATQRGQQALAAGEIGAVLVAGGQGSRLGFDHPKGMFPVGPVSGRTLFQTFADQLLALQQHYGVEIPLYLMTSPATDAETREYFAQHDFLGLNPDSVKIFCQGTMPAVSSDSGKLLMETKSSLALSPDGHGGTVTALQRSGALADAKARNVRQLFYFQVDNPLVSICDPTVIGHHLMAESELTTLVVRKRYPTERVGNVVAVDGNVQIIEYSDLPDDAAARTDETGQLKLWAGNIAVHVMSLDFLTRAATSDQALPFHRASKKVPCLDSSGVCIDPSEPNGVKFEKFIFDLLPSARGAFVVEATPAESFAPVKNADGAETDTPELARAAISDLHRNWIESAGAVVDSGVRVEINPRFALNAEALRTKIAKNTRFSDDQYFNR